MGIRRVASEEMARPVTITMNSKVRRRSETDVIKPLPRKRVRIQTKPLQVVEAAPHALLLSPLEKGSCWYTKEDLVDVRKSARRLSRQVNTVDSVLMDTFGKACELTFITAAVMEEEPHHPTRQNNNNNNHHHHQQGKAMVVQRLQVSAAFWKQRGLERLSQGHAISRSIQVCSVKSAVLLEQTSQYLEGVQDPERLAHASRMASRPSQQFAEMLAMADHAMANKIHSESSESTSSTSANSTTVAPTAKPN